MIALLAAWMCFKPLTLGMEPIGCSMSVGAEIARSGKGVDRLLLEDRQVVGKWARTYLPHDAEDVIWISPDLVSRWLGYLQESENLTEPEVSARWAALAKTEGKTLWFIVRLAALDKQDPLDMGMEEAAQTNDLDPVVVRATLTDISGHRIALRDLHTKLIATFRSSDADELIGLPWYIYSDVFKPLLPAIPPSPLDSDLGSNEARLLLVQADVPDATIAAREVEIRVLSRRKTRIAHFPMLRHIVTQIQSQDANRDVQRGFGTG
jgi:hypothetical protein